MRVLLWIDQKFLDIAYWIAKKWNWWTGKNQFALARLVLSLGFALVFILFLILPIKDNRKEFFSFNISYSLLFIFWYWITGLLEKIVLEDAKRGVRRGNPDLQRFVRLVAVFFWVLHPVFDWFRFGFAEAVWMLFVISLAIAWLYLVSISTPPFKRSQALEAIRNLFAKPVPATVSNH